MNFVLLLLNSAFAQVQLSSRSISCPRRSQLFPSWYEKKRLCPSLGSIDMDHGLWTMDIWPVFGPGRERVLTIVPDSTTHWGNNVRKKTFANVTHQTYQIYQSWVNPNFDSNIQGLLTKNSSYIQYTFFFFFLKCFKRFLIWFKKDKIIR